ncbi:MAG: ABC transporter ATP-binding protein [Propioniciclava sp.]|uniref:ABC transporter ATP-binding protein n=1 Tax=Propioniciclava sp. TaxID=2038686 RepID=UPI0039E4F47E
MTVQQRRDGLVAEQISLTYPGRETPVLAQLDARVAPGVFTVIVGPNACGKSTLLRAFGRVLRPTTGRVALDGTEIGGMNSKQFARAVALLPQSAVAPDGITVGDLVARGRFPHQGMFRQWSKQDEQAVIWAMERTRTIELADRRVAELSGGQRQRVWIAMALAQQTEILLLDEPTTYLDLAHQLEVLDLCRELVEEHGKTVVAVLHDLNQAFRYADRLIAMRAGQILATGVPETIVTRDLVHDVFGIDCQVVPDPLTGTPMVVPRSERPRVLQAAGDGTGPG